MDTKLNRKLLLKLITNSGIVKAIGSLCGLRNYKLLLMTNGYDMYCIETIQCLPRWNLGLRIWLLISTLSFNESLRKILGNKQMAYA